MSNSTAFKTKLYDVRTGASLEVINLRNAIECIDFINWVIPFAVYKTYWPSGVVFEYCDYETLLTMALFIIEAEGY